MQASNSLLLFELKGKVDLHISQSYSCGKGFTKTDQVSVVTNK